MKSKINLEKMCSSADQACELMKVMANLDRLLILCELSQGERCVGELEEILEIHQPTLSQQLTVLRNKELVTTRREGKQIYYSLSHQIAMSVMLLLYKHYCE